MEFIFCERKRSRRKENNFFRSFRAARQAKKKGKGVGEKGEGAVSASVEI